MSKLGDKVITKETQILMTIANFAMLLIAIVSAVFFAVTWKASIEYNIQQNCDDIVIETEARKAADSILQEKVDSANALLVATEAKLIEMDLKAEKRHAETQTNFVWMIAWMEDQ